MFHLSGLICVDESIVCWYGLGGHWISKGLPHYVALDRKPNNGAKICNSCCGVTGILTCLELCQLAAKTEQQEIANPNPVVPSGTASGTRSILNLTQPFFGTRHVVVGSSAFASVNIAMQLSEENLGFIGIVKTATKWFSMEPLQKTILPKKGQYTGMTTTIDGVKLMSYVWSDRNRHYFISTAGSMVMSNLQECTRCCELSIEGAYKEDNKD